MAKFSLQNVRLFLGGADLTGVNNQAELTAEAESKDSTAFAPTGGVWHEELPGIRSAALSGGGQWEAGDLSKVDDQAFASLATSGAVSVCPAGAADGALAWLSQFTRRSYQLGGAVGDVVPWSTQLAGSWPLVRGAVLATPTARIATGSGTAVQLGAVPAGKALYAAVHVLSLAGTGGPALTVKIQSDDAAGMATPTDQITFAAQTALGGQILRVPGPITDTWLRATWTITGATPSFLFAVTAGIA